MFSFLHIPSYGEIHSPRSFVYYLSLSSLDNQEQHPFLLVLSLLISSPINPILSLRPLFVSYLWPSYFYMIFINLATEALYTRHALSLSCRHLIVQSQMQSKQGKKYTADPSNGWLVMEMLADDVWGLFFFFFFLCCNLFYCNMPASKNKEIEFHKTFIELWKFCNISCWVRGTLFSPWLLER